MDVTMQLEDTMGSKLYNLQHRISLTVVDNTYCFLITLGKIMSLSQNAAMP